MDGSGEGAVTLFDRTWHGQVAVISVFVLDRNGNKNEWFPAILGLALSLGQDLKCVWLFELG